MKHYLRPFFLVIAFSLCLLPGLGSAALPLEAQSPQAAFNSVRLELLSSWGGSSNALAVDNGRVYADQGGRLAAYQLINPNYPKLVGTSEQFMNSIRDIVIENEIAYLAAGASLGIADLSNPDRPRRVAEIDANVGQVLDVALANGYLFVTGSTGVRILKINTPLQPDEVLSYSVLNSDQCLRSAVLGEILYIAEGNQGLRLVDVSDPTHPSEIKLLGGFNSLVWVEVFGTRAYVLDYFSADNAWTRLYAFDLSDPAAPVEVGRLDLATSYSALAIHNEALYLIGGSALAIVDSANPAALALRSVTLVDGILAAQTLLGPYLLLASSTGLQIVDIQAQTGPEKIGNSLEFAADQVLISGSTGYLFNLASGLRIYDLSHPKMPRLSGQLSILAEYWPQMKQQGTTLYLVNGKEFSSIAVNNPVHPLKLGRLIFGEYINDFILFKQYAILLHTASFSIVDLSNPSQPALVKTVVVANGPLYLAASETHLYLVRQDLPQVDIYSLQNPADPQLAGSFPYLSPAVLKEQVVGSRLYLLAYGFIYIYDLTVPTAPVLLNGFAVYCNDLALDGFTLYLGCYEGIQILDVEAPAAVQDLGFVRQPSLSYARFFIEQDRLYAVNQFGLHQFQRIPADGAAIPAASGGSLVSSTGDVRYQFPAGYYYTDVAFSHSAAYRPSLPGPGQLAFAGPAFNLDGYISYNPAVSSLWQPFTIQAGYDPAAFTNIEENSLALYRWNGSAWEKLAGSQVYTHTQTVQGQSTQVGLFAILGERLSKNSLLLPMVQRSASSISGSYNLKLSGLSISQAIQRPDHGVPLITGRRTLARLTIELENAALVENASITIHASQNGVELAGSPLRLDPWTIFSTSPNLYWSQNVNLMLPETWTGSSVTLVASVSAPFSGETDLNDNQKTVTVSYVAPLGMRVMQVPVNYTRTSTGQTYPGPTQELITDQVLRQYPISTLQVNLHAPAAFSGELANGAEWTRLVAWLNTLKVSEGGQSAVFYYGILSKGFPSAWGGMGYLDKRAAVGFPSASDHEFGHNLGVGHTPCGVESSEPTYPYPGASIGFDGVDLWQKQILPASSYKDLMSYCTPQWVSDFSYLRFYQGLRSASSVASPAADSLLVRLELDANGRPMLLPVYRLTLPPSGLAAESAYHAELLAADGSRLAFYPLEVLTATAGDQVYHNLQAVLPLPAQPAATLRIWYAGEPVEQLALDSDSLSAVVPAQISELNGQMLLSWPTAGLPLRQGERPVLVRFRPEGESAWQTIGLDVAGGQLLLDQVYYSSHPGEFEVVFAAAGQPGAD